MSKLNLIILLIPVIFLSGNYVHSQSAEIKNEFFERTNIIQYIGENDTYVYKLLLSDTIRRKKIKLIAVSKENRKVVIGLPLKGVTKDKEYYRGLDFHTCVVQDDRIVIFWSKTTKDAEELYIETYDDGLQRTQSIQKKYTNTHAYDLERSITAKQKSSIVVVVNPFRTDEIFIGGEIPVKNNYVQLEYAILGDDLLIPSLSKIALPVQLKTKSFGKFSTYHYLENGNMLIRSNFTAEEGKDFSRTDVNGRIVLSDLNPYHSVSYLDVTTNEILTIELPVDRASFFEVSIQTILVGDELRIYGLATNVDDDSNKFTGLFYAGINVVDFSSKEEFIPFEKGLLNSMYEEESSEAYYINNIKMKDENILFFMSDGTTYHGAAFVVLEYTVDHKLLQFGSERDF
jgi:hypothetical protein